MADGYVGCSPAELYEKLCSVVKEAQRLSKEESKLDPESDPYRSKYRARALLQDVLRRLGERVAASSGDGGGGEASDQLSERQLRNLECLALVRMGADYIDCEENTTGEEYLEKALRDVETRHLEVDTTSLELHILNQLGILWATRRQNDRALEYLKKAQSVYNYYKLSRSLAPLSLDDLLSTEVERSPAQDTGRTASFEAAHTRTLYYLTQVHADMGDAAMSARYCHATLQRQLDERQYVPAEWSLSAATLSQYYLSVGDFSLARHCMAAAECVFLREMAGGNPPPPVASPVDEEGSLANKWADLRRFWVKYGLALLEASKQRLLSDDQTDVGGESCSGRWRSNSAQDDEQRLNSLMLRLDLKSFEEIITDQPILEFEQANTVFLQVQRWIGEASRFYVLDGYCSDYVQLVQDHSRCYEHLALFENDPERQCHLHRQRVDMLSALADELNKEHYTLAWRQLVYELAEAYSAMVDAKVTAGNPDPGRLLALPAESHRQAADQVNRLARSAIARYTEYVSSLSDGPPGAPLARRLPPRRFAGSHEQQVLIAWFCIARLYSRLTDGGDLSARLVNTQASHDHYCLVVDYCEQNPVAASFVSSELTTCREMVATSRAKMDRIRSLIERRAAGRSQTGSPSGTTPTGLPVRRCRSTMSTDRSP